MHKDYTTYLSQQKPPQAQLAADSHFLFKTRSAFQNAAQLREMFMRRQIKLNRNDRNVAIG